MYVTISQYVRYHVSLSMLSCLAMYVTMLTMYVTICVTIYVTMCLPYTQVKNVYVQFLMHAYIDTDVELREVYSRDTMWELFENFLPDISTVSHVFVQP